MNLAKPALSILDQQQKERIHAAVADVLSRTGVVVKEPKAVEILYEAGAIVEGERVKIPSQVLDRALAQAPNIVSIYDREGNPAMELGTERVYFGAHADTPEILDFATGDLRRYTLNDAGLVARLCDALPHIDFISQNGFAENLTNPRTVTTLVFARMMRNTSKPLGVGCYDADELKLVLDVASTVRTSKQDLSDRPFFYHYSEPTSPLTHTAPSLRRLLMAVEHGIPLVYTPMVMSGATGPATFAGTIVQALAESLSGIVLAQTVRPGTPCITGGIPTVMDMSTTICSYGAPEMSLMSAALTEMAKFYGLPMFSTGGCSDAPAVDCQLASEFAFSCLASALSGAHLIHDTGFFYHAERVSAESFVLSDEIIGMVRSFIDGIQFDDDALAVDLIDAVGPTGNFIAEDHTLNHFRRFWTPRIFNRTMKEHLYSDNDLHTRLTIRAHNLLATHQPHSLSVDADTELSKLERRLLAMND